MNKITETILNKVRLYIKGRLLTLNYQSSIGDRDIKEAKKQVYLEISKFLDDLEKSSEDIIRFENLTPYDLKYRICILRDDSIGFTVDEVDRLS